MGEERGRGRGEEGEGGRVEGAERKEMRRRGRDGVGAKGAASVLYI